jgi:hypothetical protein
MVTADQYRQYAKEALDWALGAETKADEMAALDLAHWWRWRPRRRKDGNRTRPQHGSVLSERISFASRTPAAATFLSTEGS